MGDDHKETNNKNPDALFSSILAESPELWDVVQQFAMDLPAQIEEMQSMLQSGSLDRLGEMAANLKASGGRYGYAVLTEKADALSRDVRDAFIDDLARKIASLKLLSRQIMAGLEEF